MLRLDTLSQEVLSRWPESAQQLQDAFTRWKTPVRAYLGARLEGKNARVEPGCLIPFMRFFFLNSFLEIKVIFLSLFLKKKKKRASLVPRSSERPVKLWTEHSVSGAHIL